MEVEEKFLIIGLGNPGKRYENTLHNMGFLLVRAFAENYKSRFEENKKFFGKISKVMFEEKKVFLLMPQTYMNDSGKSIMACLRYYKIDIDKLLVVVDDVSLSFGVIRLRNQ